MAKKEVILGLVKCDPGVGFIDIQKTTGYANGVLSYHLKKLENEGSIRIKRGKRKIWAFSSDLDPKDDAVRIYLRKETCKKILLFLLNEETANFIQIRDAIRKSSSTTSLALKMLIENKLVKKNLGFPRQYYLEDQQNMVEIIDRIRISKLDELKDRFADTFSYL